MLKQVSGFILRLFGWRIDVDERFRLQKAVVIMAPHTSMKDFWIGRLAFWYLQLPVKFLIKKEMFWFPLGIILKFLGAIPVDRQKSGNITNHIVQMFQQTNQFLFVITPEGTRQLNHNWKKGFYKIALMAEVPILFGYIDYKKKVGGIGDILIPSGDYDKDLKIIYDFYKNIHARYPEKFNLSPMYWQQQ